MCDWGQAVYVLFPVYTTGDRPFCHQGQAFVHAYMCDHAQAACGCDQRRAVSVIGAGRMCDQGRAVDVTRGMCIH